MSNEKIPMPSPDEKRRAIENILDTAFPQHPSKFACLVRIFRTLGLRGLLFDTADCFALSAVTAAIALAAVVCGNCAIPHTAVFAISPVFYLVLFFTVRLREKYSGIGQIKYTCRFTPLHICVAQNIMFSGVSLVLCTFTSLGVQMVQNDSGNVGFIGLWCLGTISQLLCSVITLLCIDRRLRNLPDITVSVYAAVCAALLGSEEWAVNGIEKLLRNTPTVVFAAVIAVLAVGYVFSILNAVQRTAQKPKGEYI